MKLRAWLSMLAVFFNMLMFTIPARAVTWETLSSERQSAENPGGATGLSLDAAGLSNDLGSSMLQEEGRMTGRTVTIPVNDSINGVNFAAAEGHSFIYAKFDGMNASGAIFGVRVIRDARGQLLQQMTQFTPADGPGFAKRFGIDPFQEFVGANGDPMFRHINREAFVTIAGMFLQHIGGTYGLLAEESTRAPITTKKSGGMLRKKITTTLTAYTKPTWFWILPSLADVRGGIPINGYKLPNGEAVYSSAIMIPAGHGTDMPTTEYVAYQTSETKKAWTGLAMVAFAAMATAMTAGAAAYFGPALMGAGMAGGASSVGWAAAGGAAVGAGSTAAYNIIVNGGDWNLATAQSNVVGGKVDIDPDTSLDKWNYRSRVNLGWQEKGVAAFAGSAPTTSPGGMADYFKEAMPSLKDQPRGATLARDAMSGDVEKPQENNLRVDLGTTGLQSPGVAVENPFGDSLGNTGLQ